ncbi:hypothetical protein GOBAR_AA28615, partial [Gossypium barbadense]
MACNWMHLELCLCGLMSGNGPARVERHLKGKRAPLPKVPRWARRILRPFFSLLRSRGHFQSGRSNSPIGLALNVRDHIAEKVLRTAVTFEFLSAVKVSMLMEVLSIYSAPRRKLYLSFTSSPLFIMLKPQTSGNLGVWTKTSYQGPEIALLEPHDGLINYPLTVHQRSDRSPTDIRSRKVEGGISLSAVCKVLRAQRIVGKGLPVRGGKGPVGKAREREYNLIRMASSDERYRRLLDYCDERRDTTHKFETFLLECISVASPAVKRNT